MKANAARHTRARERATTHCQHRFKGVRRCCRSGCDGRTALDADGREVRSGSALLLCSALCETKISDVHVALLAEQQVCGLDVAVQHERLAARKARVQVVQATHCTAHDAHSFEAQQRWWGAVEAELCHPTASLLRRKEAVLEAAAAAER